MERHLHRMNVLIDATGITRNKAGVGVYAKSLIEALIALEGRLRLFILAQDDDLDLDYSRHIAVTMIWVPGRFFRKLPLRFLLEQIGIPLLASKHKIDVIHSLHYSFPIVCFGARQVVTIHDMTFFDMPEVHVRFKVFYFRLFIRAAIRFADGLIFVSHSARRDCEARLGSPRGNSYVIHHGKSEAFHSNLDAETVHQIRERYGLTSEFVLYIGTIEPRKNLVRLVSAFASIAAADPNIKLVIAGMKGWMYDSLFQTVGRLGLETRVIFTGFIPEADKPFLMAAARVFIYPSLYEGFGIPVLEALACGVPTITSNTSSLPEVAGDAALMIDPLQTTEIAEAIKTLLTDHGLREQLRAKSKRQAEQFTWERTAALTLKAYANALETPSTAATKEWL